MVGVRKFKNEIAGRLFKILVPPRRKKYKAKSAVLNPQFLILQSVAIFSVLIVHKQKI